MKTIVLENVRENHLTLISELAKTLKFDIKSVSETKSQKDLNARIERIENGTATLIEVDWEQIEAQANSL